MPILPVHCRCSGGDNPGPVPKPIRHVTTQMLCSWCPDAGDDCKCESVQRVIVRNSSGELISQTDYAADGKTPFTLKAGCVIGDCSQCPCGKKPGPVPDPQPIRFWNELCDWNGVTCEDVKNDKSKKIECTPFRRLVEIDPKTKEATLTDYTVGGDKRYETKGLPIDCSQCPDCRTTGMDCPDPEPICVGLDALDPGTMWCIREGMRVESVQLMVVCGPVFVTPCCGVDTQDLNEEYRTIRIDEPGTVMSWSAPTVGCKQGELCEGFTIETADERDCGGQAYVSYTSIGCGEYESESEESGESWAGYEDPCDDCEEES